MRQAPAISAMSSGLFVRLTAAAAPMAHAHQAHGWVVRVSWLTVTPEFLTRWGCLVGSDRLMGWACRHDEPELLMPVRSPMTDCSGMTVRAGRATRRDTIQRRPLWADHLP